jgi:nucleoid-associated protein YgaU
LSSTTILKANPEIRNPDNLYAGQTVNIPAQAYTIKSDDTLEAISERLNISLASLEGLNPELQDPNFLVPSEILKVPASHLREPLAYIVEPRDTLWSIANKFEIALAELDNANPQIENKNLISVGQIIRVPVYLPSQSDATFKQKCNACEKAAAPTGARFPWRARA